MFLTALTCRASLGMGFQCQFLLAGNGIYNVHLVYCGAARIASAFRMQSAGVLPFVNDIGEAISSLKD